MKLRDLILEHTVVSGSRLCPEIPLRLVTEECELFRMDEEAVEEMGIPEPFWAFCWAGGEALARFVLDRPEWVEGRSVLAFGSGCGIDAVAAARSGAEVCATDIDPAARVATALNAELNDVCIEVTGRNFVDGDVPAVDVVLVGDVCYDEQASRGILAWLDRVARAGVTVLIGDPHRGFVERARVERLASYEAPADNDRHGQSLTKTSVFRLESSMGQPGTT